MLTLDKNCKKEITKREVIQQPAYYWKFQPTRYKVSMICLLASCETYHKFNFYIFSAFSRVRILGNNSPCNFRQMLRPIQDPPTESLRKRMVERSQNYKAV